MIGSDSLERDIKFNLAGGQIAAPLFPFRNSPREKKQGWE